MKTRTRRATRLIVGVACLVLVSQLKPMVAEASPYTFRSFQHNVRYTYIGAINSASQNASKKPLVISAQELCRDEYTTLRSNLISRGYTVYGFRMAPAGHTAAACHGTDGAIVMVASIGASYKLGSSEIPLRGPFPGQSSVVKNGYVCIRQAAFLYGWHVCSTHMSSSSEAAAVAQSNYMKDVAAFLNDRPIMVGGDFNRTPTQTGPNAWYSSFDEVDQTGPMPSFRGGVRGSYTYKWYRGSGTTNGVLRSCNPPDWSLSYTVCKKIDYFFSGKIRMTAGFGLAEMTYNPAATYSDHLFLWGYNQFP